MLKKTVVDSIQDNIKLCECGCGQPVTPHKYYPRRFRIGHSTKFRRGEKGANWRGGMKKHKGYNKVYKPDHPFCDSQGYVLEHRLVMENHIGRYMTQKEEVHHIDRNKQNNKIENLMLFENHARHTQYEKTIDMSDRYCLECNSKTTYRKKKRNNAPQWYRFKDGYRCRVCHDKDKRHNKKRMLLKIEP